jgi:hypothetical protein
MNHETVNEIEIAVARYFDTRVNMIIPNVFWGLDLRHECDIFVLTKTGWAYEVEIKVDKYDLKADAKKRHGHNSKLLKRLYFAIPKKLEPEIKNIPERAGVLVVDSNGKVSKIREAIQNKLAIKIGEEKVVKLGRLAAMRIWNLKKKIKICIDIEQQADDLKCCGNCKHYTPRGDCRSKHGYSPGHYCDFWYTDGLTRKDRE